MSRLHEAAGKGCLENPTQTVPQHPHGPAAGNRDSFQLLWKEPGQEVFVLTGSSLSGSVKLREQIRWVMIHHRSTEVWDQMGENYASLGHPFINLSLQGPAQLREFPGRHQLTAQCTFSENRSVVSSKTLLQSGTAAGQLRNCLRDCYSQWETLLRGLNTKEI